MWPGGVKALVMQNWLQPDCYPAIYRVLSYYRSPAGQLASWVQGSNRHPPNSTSRAFADRKEAARGHVGAGA